MRFGSCERKHCLGRARSQETKMNLGFYCVSKEVLRRQLERSLRVRESWTVLIWVLYL
jgi:hypothetical protein